MEDPSGYGVVCECGKTLPVQPAAGAAPLLCSCGRRVVVPLPEEFTGRRVVLSAASLDRRVWRLDEAGELPPPGPCAGCHIADASVVDGILVCERYKARASGGQHVLLLPFLLPFLFVSFLFTWQTEERLEIHGRDTDLPAPVRLCPGCRKRLRPVRSNRYWLAAILVVAAGVGIAFLQVLIGLAVLAVGFGLVVWIKREVEAVRQQSLLNLLRPVPIYRQVLERYPNAAVVLKDR